MTAELIEPVERWTLTDLGESVLDADEDRYELTPAGVAVLDT